MTSVAAPLANPPANTTLPRPLALVITELEPGGAERAMVELATRLDPHRFQVEVYALAGRPAAPRDLLVRRLEAAGIRPCFLGCSHAWQGGWAVRRLASHFRHQRPQLVQTFLFHANLVGVWAARLAGVPRVVTSIRVADPRPWRMRLERCLTRSAERMVCVSQSVADHCRRYGFPPEKLVVVPNGVDLEQVAGVQPADLRAFGVAPGHKALLFVGRLDPQKGIDAMLPRVAEILQDFPDWEWLLAGDGPLRRRLERMAAASGVAERIHFVGWQPQVLPLLAAGELLLLPSRWEGMPNVVLEAMACGKPVLATRTEGMVELLGAGVEAQTVSMGDWHGMAARLRQWLDDSRYREQLGVSNRLRVKHFSIANMVARYSQLYEQLLDPSK